MILGSKQNLAKLSINSIKVGESVITPQKCVHNIGAVFAPQLAVMPTSHCENLYSDTQYPVFLISKQYY